MTAYREPQEPDAVSETTPKRDLPLLLFGACIVLGGCAVSSQIFVRIFEQKTAVSIVRFLGYLSATLIPLMFAIAIALVIVREFSKK